VSRGAISSLIAPHLDLPTLVSIASWTEWDGLELRVAPRAKSGEIGFWGTSLPTIDEDAVAESTRHAVRDVRDGGLDVASLSTYVPLSDRGRALAVLRAAHDTEVPAVRLQPGPFVPLDERRRRLAVLAADARTLGVKILLETHFGTQLASASAARLMVEGTDPTTVGVILDTGNLLVEGYEDWTVATEVLGEYLHAVHVKNVQTGRLTPSGREYSWSSLRGGDLDLEAVLETVMRTADPEWIVVEDLSDPIWTVERSREWRQLFATTGAAPI